MDHQEREQSRFSSWLLIALTLFGLAYLAAIPFDLLKRKFDVVDAAIFVALLIFNSGFLKRLGKLVIGSKGVELELQEVKIEQKKQRIEIDTLRFLITSYVTEKEMVHLTKLANKEPFPYKKNSSFESELRRLRSLDFIRNLSGKTVGGMPTDGDLRDYFELTPKGIEYIQLRQDLIMETGLAVMDVAPNNSINPRPR
jgi:hypothetical protein